MSTTFNEHILNIKYKYNQLSSEVIYAAAVYSILLICLIIKKYKLYNIMFIPSIILLTLVFGILNTLIGLIFLTFNLLFIWILKCESKHHIAHLSSLSALFGAHFYYKVLNLPDTIDICSFLMIITIQFYWIGKFAGKYKLMNIINYLLCPASVFAGPAIPLNVFVERLEYLKKGEEDETEKIKNKILKPNLIGESSVALINPKLSIEDHKEVIGIDSNNQSNNTEPEDKNMFFQNIKQTSLIIQKRINDYHLAIIPTILSGIYAVLYLFLTKNCKYTSSQGFIINLKNLILSGFALRCKFYFIWTLSEANFACLGFPNIVNIRPLNIELATSVKDLTASWNIYTNLWLKDSVFEVFKSTSISLASLLTFFVSSFYHGPNICYPFMFITLSLIVPIIKQNNIFMARTCNPNFTKLVNVLVFIPLLAYLMAPFKILSLKRTLYVWKGVYFFGHIFLLTCFIIHLSKSIVNKK